MPRVRTDGFRLGTEVPGMCPSAPPVRRDRGRHTRARFPRDRRVDSNLEHLLRIAPPGKEGEKGRPLKDEGAQLIHAVIS